MQTIALKGKNPCAEKTPDLPYRVRVQGAWVVSVLVETGPDIPLRLARAA